MSIHRFKDRRDAGHLLARHLSKEIAGPDLVVTALPRGGVEIGFEIANYLSVALTILIVRKLGSPMQPELAIGAIASGGHTYLNQELIARLGIEKEEIAAVIAKETLELKRREERYSIGIGHQSWQDKKVLIVDDGIATGATMQVAIDAIRAEKPKFLGVAVPVATVSTVERMTRQVDRCFVLQTPDEFSAIGEFYESFPPVSDDEVVSLLQEARARLHHDNKHGNKT